MENNIYSRKNEYAPRNEYGFAAAEVTGNDEGDSPHEEEQSEEDYKLNGPRCLHPTPQTEKVLKLYLYDNEIAKLKKYSENTKKFANVASLLYGSLGSFIAYNSTQEVGESLLAGVSAGLASYLAFRTINYLGRTRPIKKLEPERNKLSELEK